MIALRQLTDAALYCVSLDGTVTSGVSSGASIKRAMRHGQHTQVKTYHSPHSSPPGGYVLVQLQEDLFIAVRCLDEDSSHRAEKVERTFEPPRREPVVEAPAPKARFKSTRTADVSPEPSSPPTQSRKTFKRPAPAEVELTHEVVFEAPQPKKRFTFKKK